MTREHNIQAEPSKGKLVTILQLEKGSMRIGPRPLELLSQDVRAILASRYRRVPSGGYIHWW